MTVYVLIEVKDYVGDAIVGIYKTEELALAKARKLKPSAKISYSVVDYEVIEDEEMDSKFPL